MAWHGRALLVGRSGFFLPSFLSFFLVSFSFLYVVELLRHIWIGALSPSCPLVDICLCRGMLLANYSTYVHICLDLEKEEIAGWLVVG